ncbi:MAG: hypothetical protein J0M08_11340 [Bacteroidetes bacterium]|nr:hypothetical protein [Bacteroidota bacterium]
MISVLVLYLRCVFAANFSSKNSDFEIAGRKLTGRTYFYPEKAYSNLLLLVSTFFQVAKQLNKTTVLEQLANSGIYIYDTNTKSKTQRIEYVEFFSGEKIEGLFSRNDVFTTQSFFKKLWILLGCFLITIVFLPLTVLSKTLRKKYSLLPLEYASSVALKYLVADNKIKKVHFFSAYERDVCINSLLLKKINVYTNIITSEVPLFLWNELLIANSISICFKYQQEEVAFFDKTIKYEKLNYWAPEIYLEIRKIYADNSEKKYKSKLGFYSTAGWLRKKLGHLDNKKDEFEIKVLDALMEVCKRNKMPLLIFLHPLEKKHKEETNAYYSSFNYQNISYADESKSNIELFYQAELVVTFFSAIAFERLFYGHKTLLFPINRYPNFPIKMSPFNSICINDLESLELSISKAFNVSTSAFFQENGIEDYTIRKHPILSVNP